jgi:hypothetical protein
MLSLPGEIMKIKKYMVFLPLGGAIIAPVSRNERKSAQRKSALMVSSRNILEDEGLTYGSAGS